MDRLALDDRAYQSPSAPLSVLEPGILTHSLGREHGRPIAGNEIVEPTARSRRTPRKSFIVVLPDNYGVSADLVAERFSEGEDGLDIIVACAGQPKNLGMLQRRVPDIQVLIAPAGTSTEDLRELAMMRAGGDIVTLVSGSPAERDPLD